MKIEIAESLIYSYLKHNEGCRFVQTNWMTSGKWVVTEYEKERAKLLFDKISKSEFFVGIFQNSSFEQLIKQAEIDVLGINTTENTIYGIDVAFHSAGLNYGSKEETASRIVKKIFRTIFIMQTYFNGNEKFNSYFITPKVNNATKILIDDLMIKAKEIINDELISIQFISNENFYSEIVDLLLINTDDDHDTAELFSRAVKLLKLDNRKVNATEVSAKPKFTRVSSDKKTVSGMKIGQFVQHSFRKAYEQNLISSNEMEQLQSPEYSKLTFDLNYEVLKHQQNPPIENRHGSTRYYKGKYFCGNYYLTSQWVEPQWELLLEWLKKIGYDYENNAH